MRLSLSLNKVCRFKFEEQSRIWFNKQLLNTIHISFVIFLIKIQLMYFDLKHSTKSNLLKSIETSASNDSTNFILNRTMHKITIFSKYRFMFVLELYCIKCGCVDSDTLYRVAIKSLTHYFVPQFA